MLRYRKGKAFFTDRVRKLMRKHKNNEIKSIISTKYDDGQDFIDSTGTTLLHLAARCGNLEMVKYLINLGSKVDVRDPSDATPLIVASKYFHGQVVKFLVEAGADMFARNCDGEYALQLVLAIPRKDPVYCEVLKVFFKKLKNYNYSDDQLTEILLHANCTLDQVIFIQDYHLTRMFLNIDDQFDSNVMCKSVWVGIFLTDYENLELLLLHGSRSDERKQLFLGYLYDITKINANPVFCHGQKTTLEVLEVLTKKIMEWEILEDYSLRFIKYIFEDTSRDILKIFLESGIVSYALSHFEYNLLLHVFANKNPGIIELLQEMKLDLKTCATPITPSNTALHLAVFKCAARNMKILLDMGNDPNLADATGEPPLFCLLVSNENLQSKIACLKLLLQYNADVQFPDKEGLNFFDYVALDDDDHLILGEIALAHLAMQEIEGIPIKKPIFNHSSWYDELNSRYKMFYTQLREIRRCKVCKSSGISRVLTSKPNSIARFVGTQFGNLIAALRCFDCEHEINGYYYEVLREKLNKALRIYQARNIAEVVISDNFPMFRGYIPVIDNIIYYLDEVDIQMLR